MTNVYHIYSKIHWMDLAYRCRNILCGQYLKDIKHATKGYEDLHLCKQLLEFTDQDLIDHAIARDIARKLYIGKIWDMVEERKLKREEILGPIDI